MNHEATRLLVHGCTGRMGTRICALAKKDNRFHLVAAIGRSDSSTSAAHNDESSPAPIRVIIDFSSDEGARDAAALATQYGASLLIGTTGLSSHTLDVLGESAQSAAVMIAPNTSRGVAVLNALLAQAARLLGDSYEVDLFEQHHRFKRDAPSGTALRLLKTLEQTQDKQLPDDRIHVVRAGDIVGEHVFQFTGNGEQIALRHSAINRDVFAHGALDAAAWLALQPAGHYTIENMYRMGEEDRLGRSE